LEKFVITDMPGTPTEFILNNGIWFFANEGRTNEVRICQRSAVHPALPHSVPLPTLSIRTSTPPTVNAFLYPSDAINPPSLPSKCPVHPALLAPKQVPHHQSLLSLHPITNQSLGQAVKLADLSIPQLSQLQKQLSSELESLSNSFAALRQAQAKFRDCLSSLSRGLDSKNGQRPILVPLTSSLYVPARLADTEKVIVDVGTGFYVEKSKDDAKDFYERKVAGLGENLGRLEGVVRAKEEGLRSVEEGEFCFRLLSFRSDLSMSRLTRVLLGRSATAENITGQ
jgi:prefoldin alpha subunit